MTSRTHARLDSARHVTALLACAILLYFAAGGTFFHQHTGGPDTACHICQALHTPALAAAAVDLVAAPELITNFLAISDHAAPSDPFALHLASRGPPTA